MLRCKKYTIHKYMRPPPCASLTTQISGRGFVFFPLVIHAMDCIVSACGIMSISETSARREDPYVVLKSGYNVAISLAVFGFGTALVRGRGTRQR